MSILSKSCNHATHIQNGGWGYASNNDNNDANENDVDGDDNEDDNNDEEDDDDLLKSGSRLRKSQTDPLSISIVLYRRFS